MQSLSIFASNEMHFRLQMVNNDIQILTYGRLY